jgi:hypothetical protein
MCCSRAYEGKQAVLAVKTIVYGKTYSAGLSEMIAYIDLYGAHLTASTYQVKAAQMYVKDKKPSVVREAY